MPANASSNDGTPLLNVPVHLNVAWDYEPGFCWVLMDVAVVYIGDDRIRANAAWDVFSPRDLCPANAVCRADTVTGCGYTLYIPPDPAMQPCHIVVDRILHVALEQRLLITISPVKAHGCPPQCDLTLHILLLPSLRAMNHSLDIHLLPPGPPGPTPQAARFGPVQGTHTSFVRPTQFSTSSTPTPFARQDSNVQSQSDSSVADSERSFAPPTDFLTPTAPFRPVDALDNQQDAAPAALYPDMQQGYDGFTIDPALLLFA